MNIPPKLIIQSIKDCCFVHFKDIKHDKNAPAHFYFVIPINADYVISIITSQWEKQLAFYQNSPNRKTAGSLVRLAPGCLPFISRESAIDCNQTELLPISDFTRRVDVNVGIEVIARNVDSDLKSKILNAIAASPLVPPNLKKILPPTLS